MTCQCPNHRDGRSYTTSYGSLVNHTHAAQRVSTNGPILSQDFHHIDTLAHLGRERIPERVVHAKGAGAYGYFELTQDLSNITSQTIFHKANIGKKIDTTVRFSTTSGELGSADTVRDFIGFAIKFKTEQGILDWVFLHSPVFFIRDPGKFPDLLHIQKRNPQTNRKDSDMFWDFFSLNPESIHQIMMLFSDLGTPDGFHQLNGYSVNTYKLCKDDNTFVYVKFHLVKKGGLKTLEAETATCLAGTNPDYSTQLLYDTIEKAKLGLEEFPEWTVKYQMMTPKDAEEKWPRIALDPTKIWPHDTFPLYDIGKLVLNKNPENFFDEIEQLAFSPSHLIPYVEHSPDPLLQSRLFMYPDTQRYRLGANNHQLPCNEPKHYVANYQRAGTASYISQGNRPNYEGSIRPLCFTGPKNAIDSQINNNYRHEKFIGTVDRFLSEVDDEDYNQPRQLWKKWDEGQQKRFVENVSASLKGVKCTEILQRQIGVFAKVDQELADRIKKAVQAPPSPPPCESQKPSTSA